MTTLNLLNKLWKNKYKIKNKKSQNHHLKKI